ncbi:MAG: 50S ribosomal protein L15 [Bacteroidota bacterium]|nr:50S ribosomal protein L15 [Bacteroidota bacterium]
MDLSKLKPAEGSLNKSKRIARGEGSGHGDTATRGHNGAKSRSGYKSKMGFEGGQMPIYRRLPKFGFKNINRVEYRPVNLGDLAELAEEQNLNTITIDDMRDKGLADKKSLVKVLTRGELTKKIDVEANAFSKSAIKAIEALGGKATKIDG